MIELSTISLFIKLRRNPIHQIIKIHYTNISIVRNNLSPNISLKIPSPSNNNPATRLNNIKSILVKKPLPVIWIIEILCIISCLRNI
ncbi:protein of unknown function (plasmid) [Azospirillum lipoferum 4B]|uniref:Uncharacterized protein n=1 Tax=Azospirillum lipoferum (strain 4B) TaxID=862719 RepID=G7ZBH7_AZOL4|nr:protein of unknown function [Azospirillum lipoferum 4B]